MAGKIKMAVFLLDGGYGSRQFFDNYVYRLLFMYVHVGGGELQ